MLYDSQQHPEDGTTAAPTVPSRSNALNFANSNFVPQVDLPSKTTTTASLTDVNAFIHQDGSRETYPVAASAAGLSVLEPKLSHSMDGSATEDTASIQSCNPTVEPAGDVESLLGEILANGIRSPSLNSAEARLDPGMRPGSLTGTEPLSQEAFEQEFQELDELNETGDNLEERISRWKSRLKHFFILSSAGKPIYTRHGDESLVSSYIGIMQTVISFYEASNDTIKGFSTSKARFVIVIQGPLYLVAISRLGESDSQLRAQLEALYMQVLSTLTLPNLTHMFCNRPSTDLRRPLQGTEPLLSSLADSFTRGSFPTLLSALECLKMRKSHRQSINNTLLKLRSPNLLYGLIVAGGRLVSVVRPKKHSLHPTDLQLIFNMLFEADGIKAGGGENWIPLCLPGYNRNGYLYMYVGFLGDNNNFNANSESAVPLVASREDEIAVLLISAKKESFFELKEMRDNVVQHMENNNSLKNVMSAVRLGRMGSTDILPGSVVRHFIYKSRPHVQFVIPNFGPEFSSAITRRKLHSLYQSLHAAVHSKNAHLKVYHGISPEFISLGWVTPSFELYCIAGPRASRNALAHGANKILQWIKQEEERVFIMGGAVF